MMTVISCIVEMGVAGRLLTWALIRTTPPSPSPIDLYFPLETMASNLSRSVEKLTSPNQDEEDEEEPVVKSKPKMVVPSMDENDEDAPKPLSLEAHIDTPPNGDLVATRTQHTLTLEAADTEATVGQGETRVGSEYRLWESSGEFGLSGPFKIQGKKRTLMLEDDMVQWYPKGKEREKGLVQ